jgi:hypothetical protein
MKDLCSQVVHGRVEVGGVGITNTYFWFKRPGEIGTIRSYLNGKRSPGRPGFLAIVDGRDSPVVCTVKGRDKAGVGGNGGTNTCFLVTVTCSTVG